MQGCKAADPQRVLAGDADRTGIYYDRGNVGAKWSLCAGEFFSGSGAEHGKFRHGADLFYCINSCLPNFRLGPDGAVNSAAHSGI